MCRKYSSGSKDIRGLGKDPLLQERRERFERDELDAPAELGLKELRQSEKMPICLLARAELDQHIYITIGAGGTTLNGPKEREARHT
jgi:hypothetical protein